MKNFTHEDQQRIWDAEHTTPQALLQMDNGEPSSGVELFYEFLKTVPGEKVGAEMGCGKGRNVIWLVKQDGIREMWGLDFSPTAIEEANRRAKSAGVGDEAHFVVQDVTMHWPCEDGTLDFVVDCFATTDIETPEARAQAVAESYRVLQSGGILFVYALSTDDEFHKEMVKLHPAPERNAFFHPTGKFEKTFDEAELAELHQAFTPIESKRIQKTTTFAGREYLCRHFWAIYQKP